MRRRVTASKIALFRRCQWWATEGATWFQSSRDDAHMGHATHAANEARQAGVTPDPEALAKLHGVKDKASLRARIEQLQKMRIPSLAQAEVAFAWDPYTDTAHPLINQKGARDYSMATDLEVCGTSDLVFFDLWDANLLRVDDLKSGYMSSLVDHQDQMQFLGLAAARAWHVDRVTLRVWGLSGEDEPKATETTVYDYELDEIAADLRAMFSAFDEADPVSIKAHPGPHCADHFCPARVGCPAWDQAANALVPAEELVPAYRLTGPIATKEEATYRLRLLPLLKKAVGDYEQQLKEFADEVGGIETEGGTWKLHTDARELLEATADALSVVEQELGMEGARVAVDLKLSAASIKRAVKAAGLPVASTTEKIVERVKAAGAVKRSEHSVYEVRGLERDP
jgi:hypothetical protein